MTPSRLMLAALAAAAGAATTYEGPRTFRATDLLPPHQVKGDRFEVATEVPLDGYFHVFSLTTDYGPLEAEGRRMLLLRLQELDAIARLDEMSKTEVFLKAAGTSVLEVGRGVVSAVQDPKATVRGVGGGLKRFGTNLGRKARRTGDEIVHAVRTAGDAGTEEEDGPEKSAKEKTSEAAGGIARSYFGVNAGARRWARKIGVDPYTTNSVLKKALQDVGTADAAGGIAAKIVLPIPPLLTTTATVGNLVWGKDPEELLKHNEQQLKELGAGTDVIKALYLSAGFTLSSQTRLVSALHAVGARGSARYVEAAAEARTESEALFFTESAEMLQRFHARSPALDLLGDSRTMVARTTGDRAVVLLPVDYVSWTREFEDALTEAGARARAELEASAVELHLTGRLSEIARREIRARGWTVVEGSEE